jgi:hypothetical protein
MEKFIALMADFFFYWAPVVLDTRYIPQPLKAYCISPALEVPTCIARCPHAYNDVRDLYQGKGELWARNGR